MQVLRLLRLPAADMALLTTRKEEARIHVCFMGKGLQPEALQAKLEDQDTAYTHIVAFRPTGVCLGTPAAALQLPALPPQYHQLHDLNTAASDQLDCQDQGWQGACMHPQPVLMLGLSVSS